MAEVSKLTLTSRRIILWGSVIIVLAIASNYLPGPPLEYHLPNPTVQKVEVIGRAMFQYANDHNGAYPTGKSSTEVFQKLLDEGYISDPSISYCAELKMPGKVPTPPNSKKLKQENVCWDVTADLDSNSPEDVPVVFSTGYKINYAPGGNGVPLFTVADGRALGIVACYHSNSATYVVNDNLPDGVVTNFISPSFNPGGKTYLQLTPDGPLPP